MAAAIRWVDVELRYVTFVLPADAHNDSSGRGDLGPPMTKALAALYVEELGARLRKMEQAYSKAVADARRDARGSCATVVAQK